MHALDVLGDPVRRRILELLADSGGPDAPDPAGRELGAGEIGEIVQREFGISQPAVSQHLRVLREHGFTTVRAEGRRRLYAVDPRGPREAREWLTPFERFWLPTLDALGTELARGKRARRLAAAAPAPDGAASAPDGAASAPDGAAPAPDGAAPAHRERTPGPAAAPSTPSSADPAVGPTDFAPSTPPAADPTEKET